jgi:hypothetical protein
MPPVRPTMSYSRFGVLNGGVRLSQAKLLLPRRRQDHPLIAAPDADGSDLPTWLLGR